MTPPTLTDSEQLALIQGVIHTMNDGVIVLDREFNILLANKWIETRRARNAPLAGQKCYTAIFGRPDTCPACPYRRSLEKGTPQKQAIRVTAGQDEANWLELCAYPLRDASGAPAGAIEHIRDITSLRQMEEHVREEAVRRQILLDQSWDGVVVLDLNGKVCEANEQYARMLGYTAEELRQLHIWDLDTESDKARLLDTLQRAVGIQEHFETSYRRKDGAMVQVEVSSGGAPIGGSTLVFQACRDITQKKAMQKHIREIGVRDPLTDMYTERYIFERLTAISAEYRRGKGYFCVSILDIDNFAAVNNFHGQKAGDLALKEFARIFRSAVRPYDFLGRYGDEKFMLVSKYTTAAETAAMMDRITEMVREMVFAFEGHKIRFTLSCGLALSSELPRDVFTLDALVSRAEQRLNEAKAAGRDRWVGPPSDGGPS